MGSITDIANQPKLQTFPDCQFMIEGEPPASQCSEAKIESIQGVTTWAPAKDLVDLSNPFTGYNLAGKKCTIIVSPTGNTGTFDIVFNLDNFLQLVQDPGSSINVEYYIHNGGSLVLTRDIPSFAAYIAAAGYAYTIKGGQLYTNIPYAQLQPACSILFDPLT